MEDGFLLAFGIVGVLTLAAMVCFAVSTTNELTRSSSDKRNFNRKIEKAAREERRHQRVMAQIRANY